MSVTFWLSKLKYAFKFVLDYENYVMMGSKPQMLSLELFHCSLNFFCEKKNSYFMENSRFLGVLFSTLK